MDKDLSNASLNDGSDALTSRQSERWTIDELRACVVAYHQLLMEEAHGQRTNKSAVRRDVMSVTLQGRRPGAYEFRMQNISYVLAELGLPWINGYKPLSNVGDAKITIIALINEVWGRTSESEAPTADTDKLETRVLSERTKLRANKPTPPPTGVHSPVSRPIQSQRYVRDPNVIAWVLELAQGKCEACGMPAPFLDSAGEPFLEVHHVRPLAEGGPDTIDNAIACCPNCHRGFHHSSDRTKLRRNTIKMVGRLMDYPKASKPVVNDQP